MSNTNSSNTQIETASLIRMVLFFVVLIALTLAHLFPLFRGLSSPQAMQQADIGRQIARGEGFTTKLIRPIDYYEKQKHTSNSQVPFTAFKDTYHAPLNPLLLGAVFKVAGIDKADSWKIGKNQLIYQPDRIVALLSTVFFLMAIGATYLLVSRVFDPTIAGVTALLMVLCDLMWQFSQSGLPQMLLLLEFTCGLYFTYRAVEAQQEGKMPIMMALTGAFFFVLMVLTHWIAAWIFVGYVIFVAFTFRPRGIVALSAFAMLALAVAAPMIRNISVTGQPFGTAYFVIYNGLAGNSEGSIMRNHDLGAEPLRIDGLSMKLLNITLLQIQDIVPFLGGLLAAPLFFLSLLHPFKRPTIANFRWLILLMWVFATLGMSIFGIDRDNTIHPNQLHILFAPIMAAYGLAFLSILWNRLEIANSIPALKYAHFIAITALSCAPMLLSMPEKVRIGMYIGKGGFPQWPPYLPSVLNGVIPQLIPDQDTTKILVTDQPWATAWYSDRLSLWLPKTLKGFDQLESNAAALNTPFAGLLITPSSRDVGTGLTVNANYGEFSSLVFDGRVANITGTGRQAGMIISDKDPKLSSLNKRYPYLMRLYATDLIFYSDSQIRATGVN
jgi:Dolichyl-phosphate-mannose-protein mannosyltransferase